MTSACHAPLRHFARADAFIRQLYQLKEALAEERYQPDPDYENRLDERAEDLRQAIEDAGGAIPDELI
jgi:hypothetical protein